MDQQLPITTGRGATRNLTNRFERIDVEAVWDDLPDDELPRGPQKIRTEYYNDDSETIVSQNRSPDIPFRYSLNPYRGCAHGCSYCYARPSHEYLGWSAGLDFESRILVKQNAAELFRDWMKKRKPPEVEAVMLSGVTDPYQPAERNFQITRKCLEAALEYRHPIRLITKNGLIRRDLDLLQALARDQLVSVAISLTSLDQSLIRVMEPRTLSPRSRLDAMKELKAIGVPVVVMTAPIIPGLNDDEIPRLLKSAAEAGAAASALVSLRLPSSVEPVFLDWVQHHFPDRRDKIVGRIQSMRDGRMNDHQFGVRMRGTGVWADHISQLHQTFSKKYGLSGKLPPLRSDLFHVPGRETQGELF